MIRLRWCSKESLSLKIIIISDVWGGRQSIIITGKAEVVSSFGEEFGAIDDHV